MLRSGMRYYARCFVLRGAGGSSAVAVSVSSAGGRSLHLATRAGASMATFGGSCSSSPAVASATAVALRAGRVSFTPSCTNAAVRHWSNRASSPGPEEKEPLAGADVATSPAKDGNKPEDELEQQKSAGSESQLSWQQRAKTFAIEYGRVGVCTHIVLSLASFSIIYAGVSSGLDVTAILESVGYTTSASEAATNSAGSMLIAYTVYKMLSPVRWPITFAVTPVVLRALRRRGYMLPAASSSAPKSPPPPSSGSNK